MGDITIVNVLINFLVGCLTPKKGPWPTEIEAAALRGRQRQRAWIVWQVFHEDTVLNLRVIMDVFFAIHLISI